MSTDRESFIRRLITKLGDMLKIADLKSQEHLAVISVALVLLMAAFFIPKEYLTPDIKQLGEGIFSFGLLLLFLLNARRWQQDRKDKKEQEDDEKYFFNGFRLKSSKDIKEEERKSCQEEDLVKLDNTQPTWLSEKYRQV